MSLSSVIQLCPSVTSLCYVTQFWLAVGQQLVSWSVSHSVLSLNCESNEFRKAAASYIGRQAAHTHPRNKLNYGHAAAVPPVVAQSVVGAEPVESAVRRHNTPVRCSQYNIKKSLVGHSKLQSTFV